MNTKASVLIAEDESLSAEALADWVAELPQLQLVALCADGETALDRIRALRPDLVLIGLRRGEADDDIALSLLKAVPRAIVIAICHDMRCAYVYEMRPSRTVLKDFSKADLADHVAPRGRP